jgi:sigma-B regulation protein RsbU (phosphoserine phosphatase)
MDQFSAYIDPEFIFDEAPIGFVSFEPNGRIVKGNERFYSWFGKTEADMAFENFFKLLSKGSNLYFQMVITPLLNLRGFSNEINFSFISETETFDTLLNAIAYKDDKGKIFLINAYLVKIIDRKRYELELKLAKKIAEESLHNAKKIIDENNEQFFQIAMNQSHMIRRPLANMLGLLTILKDVNNLPAEADNLLKLLQVSAEDMDELIKEVIAQTQPPQ